MRFALSGDKFSSLWWLCLKSKFLKYIYRVSQEECARLREGVHYVKVYRYNPKHLCPKLNGYGDNGQRKVSSSCGSKHCTCQLTILYISVLECRVVSCDGNSAHAHSNVVGLYRNAQSAMLRHRWAFSCIVLGTLRTTMT